MAVMPVMMMRVAMTVVMVVISMIVGGRAHVFAVPRSAYGAKRLYDNVLNVIM